MEEANRIVRNASSIAKANTAPRKSSPASIRMYSAIDPGYAIWVWSADRYRSSDRAKIKYALIFTGKLLFPKRGLNPMAPLIRITAIENVINIDLLYPFAINSTMY